MSRFIVPNTFIPGTKAKAQDVNENFTAIQNEINTKAIKSGDETQTFFVAPAIENNQAITKLQVENLIGEVQKNVLSNFDNGKLSLFAKSGNVNTDGFSDLISFSGLELTFLVGGSYPNLVGNIQNSAVEITTINNYSLNGFADGIYNIFVDKNGEISTLTNKIYVQPKEPSMVIDDIWVNTSILPQEIKQYNGSEKIDFAKLLIGKVEIENSQIKSVSTIPYNSEEVTAVSHTKSAKIIETYINGNSWYRLWSDNWLEQGGQYGISPATGVYTFLKPFKNTNYTICANPIAVTGGAGTPIFSWINGDRVYNFTETGFTYGSYNGGGTLRNFYVCGYAN